LPFLKSEFFDVFAKKFEVLVDFEELFRNFAMVMIIVTEFSTLHCNFIVVCSILSEVLCVHFLNELFKFCLSCGRTSSGMICCSFDDVAPIPFDATS
jgi:hypothetical protein